MKISVAQIRPTKGDIAVNIAAHKKLIELAGDTDAIFFPELSITGYEPELAKELATNKDDERFEVFQQLSEAYNITIGIGVPTNSVDGTQISMIVFQPHHQRQPYSKQQLHSDELPYFTEGTNQLILQIGHYKIAPAICFESLQPNHSEKAFGLGADVYLTSVAKSQNGVDKAMRHYPEVAKKFSLTVLMANCVGYCDNFLSVGNSAVWTKDGEMRAQLDSESEGILIFDLETEEVRKVVMPLQHVE